MSKATQLLAMAACAIALNATAADPSSTGELTIRATGFADARGHAVAKLFIPGDKVLGRGRWQETSAIEGGVAVFQIGNLVPGRYAVVVFHDLNDNGVIDHGLLGPAEPLGFSGRFVLGIFSGRPDFEQLQFELRSGPQTLEVSVK